MASAVRIPRLIIAGTHSGVGKTSVAVGLMAAFRDADRVVQPFKVGPDYLDPGYHAVACGRSSWPLDSWMMGQPGVRQSFARGIQGAEIALVEGMMGLYDGASGSSETGSTAEVAKLLKAPVLLVIDAAGLARSAGALVLGYRDFDPHVHLAGVIANRVAGEGHLAYLRPGIEERLGLPLLGGLPEDEALGIPERHLGLIGAGEQADLARHVERLGAWVLQHLDLACLWAIAEAAPPLEAVPASPRRRQGRCCRLAVAQDAAFCFYYPDNLALLEALGAELVPFSPLADRWLPADVQGLYLGGGYPELHAATLAENKAMRGAVHQSIAEGLPTLAECGGFMYLCEALVSGDGQSHPMVGAIPGRTVMERRLQAIGYREVTLCRGTVLGRAGEHGRGHEFHHSRYEGEIPADKAALAAAGRQFGYATETLLASYVHLHFGSNPRLAEHFLERCARRRS